MSKRSLKLYLELNRRLNKNLLLKVVKDDNHAKAKKALEKLNQKHFF